MAEIPKLNTLTRLTVRTRETELGKPKRRELYRASSIPRANEEVKLIAKGIPRHLVYPVTAVPFE